MELSESITLADQFILSLIFKVHSLPRNERSESARRWWRGLETRLGPGAALKEHRQQLEILAPDRHLDRNRDRQLFLSISAIVDDDGNGRCPALLEKSCGIYSRRPFTCRAVPLHYSRPPSTLESYLDGFVRTPGYECATSDAPEILKGSEILSGEIRKSRDEALLVAKRDWDWKTLLGESMKNAASAQMAGLPTFSDVIANSDRGYATMAPIIYAWRAAAHAELMTWTTFAELCRKQIGLAETAIDSRPERHSDLSERILLYRSALLARAGPILRAVDGA